jgi:hypothetical protein
MPFDDVFPRVSARIFDEHQPRPKEAAVRRHFPDWERRRWDGCGNRSQRGVGQLFLRKPGAYRAETPDSEEAKTFKSCDRDLSGPTHRSLRSSLLHGTISPLAMARAAAATLQLSWPVVRASLHQFGRMKRDILNYSRIARSEQTIVQGIVTLAIG